MALYRGVGPKCPCCTGDDEKGFHQVSQLHTVVVMCPKTEDQDRLVKVVASRGGSANFEPDSKP